MGMIVVTTMDARPNYCYDCPCHNGEHGIYEADKEKRSTFEYRPYWCPLKKQEAVKPRRDAVCVKMFRCGVCGEYVGFIDSDPGDSNEQDNFCRNCGIPVKWG